MRNSLSITAKNVIECKKTVCNAENNRVELHKEDAASYPATDGGQVVCVRVFRRKTKNSRLSKNFSFWTVSLILDAMFKIKSLLYKDLILNSSGMAKK